jgi:hypothetical protein
MSCVRLVPFRISVRDLSPFGGRACRGFRSVMWPSPRAPGAPPPPMRPLLLSLSHLDFPRNNLPLLLPPLSLPPCGALGFGVKITGIWIPGGEFSPSPSLLSLSLPLHSSSPARAPAPPCSPPRPCSLPRGGSAPARPPARFGPGVDPAQRLGPCARPSAPLRAASRPRRDSRSPVYPLTRSRVCKPTRAVIIFGCS